MRILTMPIKNSATSMARKCRISVAYDDGQVCPIGELTCPFQEEKIPCWKVTKNDWLRLIKEKESKNDDSKA